MSTQLQDPPRLAEPPRRSAPSTPPAPPAPARSSGGWFGNRSIGVKVLLGLIPLLLAVAAVAALAIDRTADLSHRTRTVLDTEVTSLQLTSDLREAMGVTRIATIDHQRAVGTNDKTAPEETIAAQATAVDALLAGAGEGFDAELEPFGAAWARYQQVITTEFLPPSRRQDGAASNRVLFGTAMPAADEAVAELDVLFAEHVADIEAAAAASDATYRNARVAILVTLVAGVVLALAVLALMARAILRRVQGLAAVIGRVADGDLTTQVEVRTRDEIGQMSAALATTVARVRGAISAIGSSTHLLASSSDELNAVSVQLAGSAEETSAQAAVVSDAADQVSHNVSTVAAGAEEMSASIREIAVSATGAAEVATSGVTMAAAANASVARLGESSAEIGEVVKLISSIAEQTNLLALNATIEAARAGEAGRGFAIVASEVKDLAKETARATEDVSVRIAAIQADARQAVGSIGEIGDIIRRISDSQTTIASAVEEQTATTTEIGRNLTEAAEGSSEIARNVAGLADAARSTTTGATDTQRAAMELSQLATELQELVGQFTY